MKSALAVAAVGVFCANAVGWAQQAGPPKPGARVTFHLDRPGIQVPRFTLTVDEDGTARYEADEEAAHASVYDANRQPSTQHIDKPLSLSRATTKKIFAAALDLNRFNFPCASKLKNIADTGEKTLRYTANGAAGASGDGTCVYNYPQDKRVVMLTDTFMAIAATLDIGRDLEFDHRFDRLGLDVVTARLVQEVAAGRAIEVGTISPVLRSIAQDSDLLERVRTRAAKLLDKTQSAL